MSNSLVFQGKPVPVTSVHTLIVGSGAAGLNAAIQLDARGIRDIVIVSEGLDMGTSINTGSDKQTYYKPGMYGDTSDSIEAVAHSFFDGGSMHGDLALAEAAGAARAFFNLVELGVPFPHDRYGQFVGYKTDHDPLQRATSCGPYTSREMCRVLIREAKRRDIRIAEHRVAVSLLTCGTAEHRRACGIVAFDLRRADEKEGLEVYAAENVVFAVGGPGGLYRAGVYPEVHTGAIGLALMAGAAASNLPESQYGMASIGFRWNVSGTYMQALPRFISTGPDGVSDEQEFLEPYFADSGKLNSMVFLKGYQWPFDPRKVSGGSSLIDILVHIETVLRGRRVFLDFRRNASGLELNSISSEAHGYLKRSGALAATPFERLKRMNPGAVELYREHGIDIASEPLEIAVCAQHNNGGLAGNVWWESVNIRHLFPVGEVNGSHGVYRPGGSALNSGQVAGFRAAEYIAARYKKNTLDPEEFLTAAGNALKSLADQFAREGHDWRRQREIFQRRMSASGAHIRSLPILENAVSEAWNQYRELEKSGCGNGAPADRLEQLRNLQLCFAHAVYLDAAAAALRDGVGSRGSALTIAPQGEPIHPALDEQWRFIPENPLFREMVLQTVAFRCGKTEHRWLERRPIPQSDAWFETAWADYRDGKITD